MKHSEQSGSHGRADENLQPITTWVRKYAQNRRSLGVAVWLIVFAVVSLVIGGTSYLAGEAYRSGNTPLFVVATAIAGLAVAAVLLLSLTRAGRNFQEEAIGRLAGREGEVNLACPSTIRHQLLSRGLATVFAVCILLQVFSGDSIPLQYRQPVSALYCIPFLVGVWFLQRPASGYINLLWPLLYGVHALLLVCGVPILFAGRWEIVNLLLPIVGYGLLTQSIAHVYARYAFHKLKTLAATGSVER